MGCLGGCLRLLLGALWRALLAAFAAVLFAQVDRYVARRYGTTRIGRLYLNRWAARGKGYARPGGLLLRARRGSRDGARPGPV